MWYVVIAPGNSAPNGKPVNLIPQSAVACFRLFVYNARSMYLPYQKQTRRDVPGPFFSQARSSPANRRRKLPPNLAPSRLSGTIQYLSTRTNTGENLQTVLVSWVGRDRFRSHCPFLFIRFVCHFPFVYLWELAFFFFFQFCLLVFSLLLSYLYLIQQATSLHL
jgi:hypothetical protein